MSEPGAVQNPPLRVGLLLDSMIQPRWVQKIVAGIQASQAARITLVVLNGAQPAEGENGFVSRLLRHRSDLLYLLYRKMDQRLFRVENDAFQSVNLGGMLDGCPCVHVTPRQTAFSDYLEDDDYEILRQYELDVALRFGFRILRGKFLQIARYGVWSYHHGDNQVNRGGPPGFWEVMGGSPVTGSILQILSERLDAGRVIYRSYAATERHSVHRNKNNYYWKSSAFVLRKLEELHACGPESLEKVDENYQPYSQRLYTQPQNREMLGLLGRWALRYGGARLANALYEYQWFLTFQFLRSGSLASTMYRSKTIQPPRDRFWADPFPIQRGGKFFLFIEEYLYRNSRGRIAVIEMDGEGNWQTPAAVLERDYHLSYPFVFHWRGHLFMIPESADNRTIEIYRCTSFPGEWALEGHLMEGVTAADTTLEEIDGRWWMFVNLAEEGASKNDELHLFYAGSPLGPWKPVRRNPVKSDARSARPAGRLFHWNGCWHRPAQDCSETYGYAISINQILRLDTGGYEEREVSKILPHWQTGLLATHTINQAGPLTVMDAMRRRRKFL